MKGRKYDRFLKDSLHTVSQWLLIPTMAILLLLILGTVACIGGIIVEAVRERSVVKRKRDKSDLEYPREESA